MRVVPVVDRIHVLNSCDNYAVPVPGETGDYESQPCTYSVYHADGTLVSASQPAKGGEVVVAYAFGLGAPDVRMQSGAAALPVCRRARRRALTT